MYPHHSYYRGNLGPAGYPARSPFLFGAPLVGGLLGGFLGSALFNYSRPYAYPLTLMDTEADRTVLVPACHMGDIPVY